MKYLYKIICKFYSFLITQVEKNFLLLKKPDKTFNINNNGYEILKYNLDTDKIINEKQINVNKYTNKKIVTKNLLFNFLNYLFLEKKLANQITIRTSFNYSIDFFTYYQISHIPKIDIEGDWYANKWHNDKPFSDNTLKIIIALNDMSSKNLGGIKILNKDESKKFSNNENNNDIYNFFEMKSSLDELLIFLPKLCYHRAGNPDPNFERSQIMIQLNPAKNWSINSNIYEKQFNLEPKFPFFNYMLEKKIYLDAK